MAEYDQRVTSSSHTALQNRFSGVSHRSAAAAAQSSPGIQARAQGMSFSGGQIVRGRIIDLRNHEIKVQLDNNRVLSGSIDDAVQLSIGDRAAFQVTKADAYTVALKVISDPRAASQETTIDKALEAASLPKSERNVSAVRALLEQGLSVDKNSIQNLLRQSATFRGVSFQTLAILQKHQLPMTQVNAEQLERFLNYEHRISNLAGQTAEQLSEAIFSQALAGDGTSAALLHDQLLSLLLPQDVPSAASDVPISSLGLLSPDGMFRLLDTLETLGLSSEDGMALLGGTMTLGEAAHLIFRYAEQLREGQGMPEFGQTGFIPEQVIDDVNPSGTLSDQAVETATAGQTVGAEPAADGNPSGTSFDPSAQAGQATDGVAGNPEGGASAASGDVSTSGSAIDAASQSSDSTASAAGSQTSDAAAQAGAAPDAIALGQAAAGFSFSRLRSLLQEAGSIFGGRGTDSPAAPPADAVIPAASQTLTGLIDSLPELLQTPEIYTILNYYAALAHGSSELSALLPKRLRIELAEQLKGRLPSTVLEKLKDGELTAAQLLKLLMERDSQSSGEDSSFLASEAYREFLKQWLTSRFTIHPKELTKLGAVADYYEEMDHVLAKLEKMPEHAQEGHSFQASAAGIRDNIDFMKALNGLFSYIQLPMRLSGKNAHAELFVYTDKKQLARDPSSVSVLLHLDMEQLGPLDVHLALEQKKVQANFYLIDKLGTSITSDNLSALTDALAAKGYVLDARVQTREAAASDPIHELLLPKQDAASMKRYTFDIRA